MASPNDTRIDPAAAFVDDLGKSWTISHEFAQRDGYNTTAHADQALWHDGNVYVLGRNGHWWRLATPGGNLWIDVRANDPTQVVPPGSSGADAVLWDGLTGVTANYFNVGALMPWEVYGGDWNDSTGVNHGGAAFSSLSRANAVGAFSIDVLACVQWMRAHNRRGIWLKTSAGYAARIAGRLHADATKRPFMTINGVVVPCAASAIVNPSTAYPQYGAELTISNALILDFDLASPLLPVTITSGSLTLYMSTAPGGQSITYSTFAARYPKIFNGGTPTLGLAAAYADDDGIENDPNVLFRVKALTDAECADYFQPVSPTHFFADISRQVDPVLGRDCIQIKYQAGGHGTDGSNANLSAFANSNPPNHQWSMKRGGKITNPANGLALQDAEQNHSYTAVNAQTPEKLYFRYYLWLAKNYQCAVDGKKLPGLGGRYGAWDGDQYAAVDGNGGNMTAGIWKPPGSAPSLPPTHPANVNGYFSGWSNRLHTAASNMSFDGTAPNGAPGDADPNNPYSSRCVLCTYPYWVQMPKQTLFRCGNSREQRDTSFNPCGVAPNGFPLLEPELWYCIETFVQMNDVIGPFDQYGNGTAVNNGIQRVWLEGVPVLERTDMKWRRHPAIKIDEVWIDCYHGGTRAPETDHTFRLADLVVANEYIGPRAAPIIPPQPTLPAWLTGKKLNTWIPISGTRMSTDMPTAELDKIAAAGLCGPAPTYASITNAIGKMGDPRGGMMGFSGGCLRANGSELVIFGGGGASMADWIGVDVRGLRLEDDAPVWRIRKRPQNVSVCYGHENSTPYCKPWAENDWTANPNVQCYPRSRHAYMHEFVDDATDRFMTIGAEFVSLTDAGRFKTMDSVWLGGTDDEPWSQCARKTDQTYVPPLTGTGKVLIPGMHPGVPESTGDRACWVCKNPATGYVYTNGSLGMYRFDPSVTDSTTYPGYTVQGKWYFPMAGPSVSGGYFANACFDTSRNAILCTTNIARKGGTAPIPLQLAIVRLTADGTAKASVSNVSLVDGNVAAATIGFTEPTINFNVPGLVYDSGLDAYLYWQDDGALYALSWSDATHLRVDQLVAAAGGPPVACSGGNNGGHQIGIWSRMQYIPKLHGVCLVPAKNQPAYFVKTS